MLTKNYFKKMNMPHHPPQLKLGVNNRTKNATFESHDPSMLRDKKSGFYYSYSTDATITSPFQMGVQIRKSPDLIHWKYVGVALCDESIQEGSDNGANEAPTVGFWAPFVEFSGGEYRMYYSATKEFGSSESRIWLAASDSPEGPFVNRGVVADTWGTDDTYPNAIDPHIVNTTEGEKYLIYGSFFGGIFAKLLSSETGLTADADTHALGTCIAKKGVRATEDGPEGPAAIYVPHTGWYYLFISYAWLGDTYDIRVGRSKSPIGPFFDYMGDDLMEQSMGTKLANSYIFTAKNPNVTPHTEQEWTWGGFRGPGHGVPFYDDSTKEYYFVHHVRDGAPQLCEKWPRASYKMHYLMIRKMEFVDDWPVLSPEPYAGEDNGEITQDYLYGEWETIMQTNESNQPKLSQKSILSQDGSYCCPQNQNGKWSYCEQSKILTITFTDGATVLAKMLKCWDFENGNPTICYTGISSKGIAYWSKRVN